MTPEELAEVEHRVNAAILADRPLSVAHMGYDEAVAGGAMALFGEKYADTAFRVLRANLDALGAQVPMLYKQYTELCEPGGARFLAFGVDPDFSDAVDGLIEVDIDRMRPKKRQRYLGEKPCEAVA